MRGSSGGREGRSSVPAPSLRVLGAAENEGGESQEPQNGPEEVPAEDER